MRSSDSLSGGKERLAARTETNRVGVTEPAGSDTFVTTTISGRDVVARMRADADARPGQTFEFAVNMDKAVAFDPKTEARIVP